MKRRISPLAAVAMLVVAFILMPYAVGQVHAPAGTDPQTLWRMSPGQRVEVLAAFIASAYAVGALVDTVARRDSDQNKTARPRTSGPNRT